MLRYRYENSFQLMQDSCKICINKHCPYVGRPREGSACIYGKFKYENPGVTAQNADWLLFQIKRDVSITRMGTTSLINEHMRDWIMPDSLKNNELNFRPTVSDAMLLKTLLYDYIIFINEKIKDINMIKRDTTGGKISFVKSIIETRILVKDNTVQLYTCNNDLANRLRKITKEENAEFILIGLTKKDDIDEWFYVRKGA